MTEHSGRVVVIGLDGATLSLLQPWIEAGELPTLGEFAAHGAHGELLSTVPPITPAAWTSAVTGVNPGKHGIFDFYRQRLDSYEFVPVNSSFRRAPPIWRTLSRFGKRVCVVNVPMTYPPESVDGCMITGLMTPSRGESPGVEFTYPASLREELRKHIPDYRVFPSTSYTKGRWEEFWTDLCRVTEARFNAIRYLIERHDPHFLMFVLNGTDLCGHFFWHVIDPSHPRHDPQEAARLGDPILRFYRFIDERLGLLLRDLASDAMGSTTTYIAMSDHGQGPLHRWFYTNSWLWRSGYLGFSRNLETLAKRVMYRAGLSPANAFKVASRLGASRGEVDFARRQRLLRRYFLSLRNVDWKRTRAYSFGNVGQIRINLQEREPRGIVPPQEYSAVREELKRDLLATQDPTDGEPLIDTVLFREALYRGAHLDLGPDIVFFPRQLSTQALGAGDFVSLNTLEPSFGNTGDHRLEGLIMLRGHNIRRAVHLEGSRISDIAPTCLYLMGLPIDTDMDGAILDEAIAEEYLSRTPVRYVQGRQDVAEERGMSPEEEEEVRKRLSDLGYVG